MKKPAVGMKADSGGPAEPSPTASAPGLTPAQHSLRARIGGYSVHSRYDSRELTQAARDRFLQRFADQVDPARLLPEGERERRAGLARKAYFARLALRSARARGARRREGAP